MADEEVGVFGGAVEIGSGSPADDFAAGLLFDDVIIFRREQEFLSDNFRVAVVVGDAKAGVGAGHSRFDNALTVKVHDAA